MKQFIFLGIFILSLASFSHAGNADAATNVNGIKNANNATGAPDDAYAELHSNGDILLLDLTDTIPVGGSYTIRWRERSNESGKAKMILEESVDGITFTTHPSAPTTNSRSFVDAVVTANVSTRFLRISKNNPPSATDFQIDAISYIPTVSLIDSDSDGIADEIDIDDDNDGILDEDEGTSGRGNLSYEYYDGAPSGYTVDNIPTANPDGSGVTSTFDVDIITSDLGVNDNTYGLRYTGFITISTTETYTFYTTSDDGSKLYIDGIEVVNNDGLQAPTENSGTIRLTPGVYSFRAEFFENWGGQVFSASYASPSISKRPIPFDVLSSNVGDSDTDNDGIINRLDLDSDNDGISDIVEAGGSAFDLNNDGRVDNTADNDADGWSDQFDADDNGTALPDSDTDGDGFKNRIDIDSDGDGIIDIIEAQVSSSNPIVPVGVDSNSDGIDNSFSNVAGNTLLIPINTDGTDLPDFLDADADNDGSADIIEAWDTDNDNRGNTTPSGKDNDGDGLDDYFDLTNGSNSTANVTNNGQTSNSFPNLDDAATIERDWREFNDTDKDGISNILDLDDDNDGILDAEENGNCFSGSISQSLNYEFYDLEPSGNSVDNIPTTGAIATGIVSDFNVNNLQNRVDQGDRDDFSIRYTGFINISTAEEYTFYTRSDDGSKLFINGIEVVNNDGDHSNQERSGKIALTPGSYTITILFYEDGGDANLNVFYASPTISKNQIPFSVLSPGGDCDTDGDGVPNRLDLDSDDDGIADIIEAGGSDTDGDGRVDAFSDADGDGWADVRDADNGGTPLLDGDQDADGLKNRLDIDSDDDGISDLVESGSTNTNGSGRVNHSKNPSSINGWSKTYNKSGSNGNNTPIDTDGDGLSNYLDLDSDSDGITDNVEAQTTLSFSVPSGSDTDKDGWDNQYDSDNGGTAISISNHDGLGAPDYIDVDSDGDGYPDWQEGFDDDKDLNARNDLMGRANTFVSNGGSALYYPNTDDADGDGLPDWLEDADGDGTPNFLDSDNATFYKDTDQDGIVDLYDVDNFGAPSSTPDGDSDGQSDFRDSDDQISLPVEMISFDAQKIFDDVQLDWKTASEINNDYFEVQRLNGEKEFEAIGQVFGAGNSTEINQYRFFDDSPLDGENYYRLKQVDFDGSFEYSEVRAVDFGHNMNSIINVLSIVPNPNDGERAYLNFAQPISGDVEWLIIDSGGNLIEETHVYIHEEEAKSRIELLKGNNLLPGIYYIKLEHNKELYNEIMIVQ